MHRSLLLRNVPFVAFFPTPDSAALSLSTVSWDQLPKKLLALESSCQGLLLGSPTQDTVNTTSELRVPPATQWADTPFS